MKKTTTLIALLVAMCAGRVFAGGPAAYYRFDSTFAQNGFLIDTFTGGALGTYIQYNEILPGANNQFWVAGVTNGTFLANKFSASGSQLMSKTGLNYLPYDAAGAYTGAISNNKFYLGGQASNGGHYQNMAYNFDGTTYPIFHQTAQPDSFLTEALYGPQYPVGQTNPNCSAVLTNGHIVTALINNTGDSLYITEFDPTPGVTVSVYPKLASGIGTVRVKAVRTIPGTNSYAVMVYNVQGSTTIFIVTNGVATATYGFNGIKYNAMIPVSPTQMLLGGDSLTFINVTNGTSINAGAALTNVLQLTRDTQSGEIYAFNGAWMYAITPAGNFDNSYNTNGYGTNFNYTFVNADYWMGSNQVYYTDMEMLGSDILISGFTPTLNNHPVNAGYAGFVIKILGKGSTPNPCANFSASLDTVYGTSGCDWNARIILNGAFPMTASISWTGGGSNVTVNSSPYIPTGLCPETYEILFEDTNHCTALVNFVTPPPVPCVAPIIHNILPVTNPICEDEQMQVGPVSVTGSLYTQQWYKEGVAITGATFATFSSPVMSIADTGSYYCIVTNGCGADTSNLSGITMVANAAPVIQQVGNQLTAMSYSPGATFQWYFNHTAINGATASTYVAAQTGTYSVTAINELTCSKNSGDVAVTVTGINDVAGNLNMNIYPNPAKEFLIITCDEEIETAEVYNVIGEQVVFVKGQITKVNVTALPQGLYTIQLKSTKGNTMIKKFEKQ